MIRLEKIVGKMQAELLRELSNEGKVNSVTIDLTENCNCNCIFCFKESSDRKNNELTTTDFKVLLLKLREAGCYVVQFSGGEIFTREDTLEIIRFAKKMKFYVCVNTNATIINDEIINTLKDLYINKVICSFHSFVEKTFKRIVRSNVSHVKILENILKMKNAGLNVEISMILTKYNIDEVKEIKEFFNKRDIFVVTDLPNSSCYTDKLSNLYPDVSQIKEYVLGNYLKKESEIYEKSTLCGIGWNGFVILSNGDVMPCHSYNEIIGNVMDFKDLTELMKHPVMTKLRKITIKNMPECINCPSNSYCNICIGENNIANGSFEIPAKDRCVLASIVRECTGAKDV